LGHRVAAIFLLYAVYFKQPVVPNVRELNLTSSFLLYMPVFAALAGGKVALYHPLQAPAGSKVLYHPLEELQRAVKEL
jgi:hypothetical protein